MAEVKSLITQKKLLMIAVGLVIIAAIAVAVWYFAVDLPLQQAAAIHPPQNC